MLIRPNPWRVYARRFSLNRMGLLWITRDRIIATGFYARVWSV